MAQSAGTAVPWTERIYEKYRPSKAKQRLSNNFPWSEDRSCLDEDDSVCEVW